MNLDIKQSFKNVGISPNDTIMIHGDAGVAAQITNVAINHRLNFLIDEIINFIGNQGTLIVPTFSYSFTKNQDFDVHNTPSDLGAFSEAFRTHPDSLRSKNPNFSVSSIGKDSGKYINSRIDDCFGSETAFDLLFKDNAKIVCLGCNFSRITFVHYVEQNIGVKYRYFKKFFGRIVDNGHIEEIENRYYVRDLSIESQGELEEIKKAATEKRVLSQTTFGRFPLFSIGVEDFFLIATELLRKNPYALTEHRFSL